MDSGSLENSINTEWLPAEATQYFDTGRFHGGLGGLCRSLKAPESSGQAETFSEDREGKTNELHGWQLSRE